uniref:ATP-dependent DNA helicase n=1 Tax=Setaria italica TaxID=4555 RepID=K3YMG7_SETIT
MQEAGKKDDKGNIDEITQYREGLLELHLPDMHMVTFHKQDKIERVVKHPGADESMLTSYFAYNRVHEEARGILYHDFPEHFTWETVNGVLLPLFQEAMERRGLIEEDNTLYECLTENSLSQMPSSLCRLFTTILMVLIDIKNMLRSMGKDIRTFPLPEIDDTYDDATSIPHEIFEEASNDQNLQDRDAYNDIMSKVDTEQDGLFFVDGPGGTGKTFLYKALLGTLHNQNKLAIATTTSGVAAYIMPSGRTTHSRFKIPLTLEDGGCSSLIIWGEASMTKRQAVEALDNSLCDIMGRSKLSFGRKTAVFGGDFKQSFLFVQKGSRAQIVDASLRRSDLLEFMRHLKLVRNMRAQSDSWFADYLLRIGGGTKEVNRDGDVRLPDDIYNINMKMIGMFQGGEIVYHSFDSTINELHNYYPSEFLNTLTLNGLPPHLLKLKIGCLIFPFQFKRKQFPVRLSFAITVNKSHGQTIGVYLPALVFSLGQLYVAMSRAIARTNIKILALPPNVEAEEEEAKKKEKKNAKKKAKGQGNQNEKEQKGRSKKKKRIPIVDGMYTKNIVYKEVLTP